MHANEIEARWMTFLDEKIDIGILALKWPEKESLTLSFRELYVFDEDFAQMFLINSYTFLRYGNNALRKKCKEQNYNISPTIRIEDLPPDQRREIRQIRQTDIGQMIAVDAIVVKISSVRPRVLEAAYRCCNGNCESVQMIYQSNEQELVEPIICDPNTGCGAEKPQARFELLPSESTMINSQFVELQEPPEKVRGGVQPERLECIFEGDLTGHILPGDRVITNGELFVRSQKKGGKKTAIFDIFLSVNSYERHNTPFEELDISEEDKERIQEIASREEVYDLLKRSIAPSIFGYESVKETLMLQLFGGVARRNPDGTRQRGDMHILLMGDPGTAKSQLLNYMSDLSPRGQYTSGKSASAAGLTAAAMIDSSRDGRWTLEAGALPLADTGLAAIDEFDKMSPSDRSSIHEAMEQQKISISKAGINATLRTRCSVLAASNPKAGRFLDPQEGNGPYTRQVDLPPPLFSRFDVIWLIEDRVHEELDKRIAAHILENRQSGVSEYEIEQGHKEDPVNSLSSQRTTDHSGKNILDRETIRKYVAFAKNNVHPTLTEEAKERIIDYYSQTRKEKGQLKDNTVKISDKDVVTITARAIESLSRMAEARARIQLRDVADYTDVVKSIELFRAWRNKLMSDGFDETSLHTGEHHKTRTIKRNLSTYLPQVINNIFNETSKPAGLHEILEITQRDLISDNDVKKMLSELYDNGFLTQPLNGYYSIV